MTLIETSPGQNLDVGTQYLRGHEVAEINTPQFLRAIGVIFEKASALGKNRFISVSEPTAFSLRDKSSVQGSVVYQSELYNPGDWVYEQKGDVEYEIPLQASLSLRLKNGSSLANRLWWTEIVMSAVGREQIQITSESRTEIGWEGNGFGILLLNVSHEVVSHVIGHHSFLLDGFPVKAIIIDEAKGNDPTKNRTGWTSQQATILGYSQVEPKTFEKWYRR